MKFRAGEFSDMSTKTTGIDYKEESDPKIKKEIMDFFAKVLPNENVRNYVLMDLASMLNPERENSQKFRVWIGEGANGKSTLMNLLQNTLGYEDTGYVGNCNATLFTRKKSDCDKPCPELYDVMIEDKRMVFMKEPEKNEELNTDLMKELSGNDLITTRTLYKGTQKFANNPCRWLLACNVFPKVKTANYSTWRRFSVTKFPSKFKEKHEILNDNNTEFYRDKNIDLNVKGRWCPEFFNTA